MKPVIGSLDQGGEARPHRTDDWNRRRVLFSFRLTEAEAESLSRDAAAAGLSPSELVRLRLFKAEHHERMARNELMLRERMDRIERLLRQMFR